MKRFSKNRIYAMDELRGLLVLGMVIHHALFTIAITLGVGWAGRAFNWITDYLHETGAILFIFICGISCHLSHSNWQRGLKLAAIAVGMSAVLYFLMPENMIWFGVLHCLAVCILLYAGLARPLNKIPALLALPLWAVAALFTWDLGRVGGTYIGLPGLFTLEIPAAISSIKWLLPFGLTLSFGGDYFPLLPWVFVFFCGTVFGRWAKEGKFPRCLYKDRFSWLSWLGRRTLWIYVLHQPVIYGVCWLIAHFFVG